MIRAVPSSPVTTTTTADSLSTSIRLQLRNRDGVSPGPRLPSREITSAHPGSKHSMRSCAVWRTQGGRSVDRWPCWTRPRWFTNPFSNCINPQHPCLRIANICWPTRQRRCGRSSWTTSGVDRRLVHVVQMRYFAVLDDREIAAVLGVTDRTVRRDWTCARLLLAQLLGRESLQWPRAPAMSSGGSA